MTIVCQSVETPTKNETESFKFPVAYTADMIYSMYSFPWPTRVISPAWYQTGGFPKQYVKNLSVKRLTSAFEWKLAIRLWGNESLWKNVKFIVIFYLLIELTRIFVWWKPDNGFVSVNLMAWRWQFGEKELLHATTITSTSITHHRLQLWKRKKSFNILSSCT